VYDHYNITLRRDLDDNNEPSMIFFLFTCKDHPDNHPVHQRARMQSGHGTKNLQEGLRACHNRTGDGTGNAATRVPSVKYTPANHRTLIAMRCAKSHCPMNSVADEDYWTEVEMLRPGTVLPHPSTVSRDMRSLYLTWSVLVQTYFAVRRKYYIYLLIYLKLSSLLAA
jgi:hypothetical protein